MAASILLMQEILRQQREQTQRIIDQQRKDGQKVHVQPELRNQLMPGAIRCPECASCVVLGDGAIEHNLNCSHWAPL